MGLLHRYTSRRFIKPPISSGSDVNLLLHVVTTQTHTQAHAHTRRQAWREYHTMRRHVGFRHNNHPRTCSR